MTMDLRHLTLIFKAGEEAAAEWGDAALSRALGDMAEVAAQFHVQPDGELFNVDRDFAEFAECLGLAVRGGVEL